MLRPTSPRSRWPGPRRGRHRHRGSRDAIAGSVPGRRSRVPTGSRRRAGGEVRRQLQLQVLPGVPAERDVDGSRRVEERMIGKRVGEVVDARSDRDVRLGVAVRVDRDRVAASRPGRRPGQRRPGAGIASPASQTRWTRAPDVQPSGTVNVTRMESSARFAASGLRRRQPERAGCPVRTASPRRSRGQRSHHGAGRRDRRRRRTSAMRSASAMRSESASGRARRRRTDRVCRA